MNATTTTGLNLTPRDLVRLRRMVDRQKALVEYKSEFRENLGDSYELSWLRDMSNTLLTEQNRLANQQPQPQ